MPLTINLTDMISRAQYGERIAALRQEFPIVPGDAVIDPGPGRLVQTQRLLTRLVRILRANPIDFLEIREIDETRTTKLWIDARLPLTEGRTLALNTVGREFADTCANVCRACGAPVATRETHFGDPPRYCPAHLALAPHGAMFTDEVLGLFTDPCPESATQDQFGALLEHDDTEPDEGDFDDGIDEDALDLPPAIELYSEPALVRLETDAKGRDREARLRVTELVKRLRALDRFRRLATLPDDWVTRIDALEANFPNFSAFIAVLRSQFMLQSLGDRVIRLPPVILNGAPGIGKTEILSRLASVLGLPPPVIIDCSTAQTATRLTGSESHWANCQEGELFSALAYGEIGNPLVYIDEIEKGGGQGRYNPVSALYGLLEKTSARKFQDLSLRNFPIDASHVVWVASANQAENLDQPIQSRFTVIQVPAPTPQQIRGIQATQFGRCVKTSRGEFCLSRYRSRHWMRWRVHHRASRSACCGWVRAGRWRKTAA